MKKLLLIFFSITIGYSQDMIYTEFSKNSSIEKPIIVRSLGIKNPL